jgi:hypothetical protein
MKNEVLDEIYKERNGGETLRAAIIHYMATSAWLR